MVPGSNNHPNKQNPSGMQIIMPFYVINNYEIIANNLKTLFRFNDQVVYKGSKIEFFWEVGQFEFFYSGYKMAYGILYGISSPSA